MNCYILAYTKEKPEKLMVANKLKRKGGQRVLHKKKQRKQV